MAFQKITDLLETENCEKIFVNNNGQIYQISIDKLRQLLITTNTSLNLSGAAADAKITGDRLATIENKLEEYINDIAALIGGEA